MGIITNLIKGALNILEEVILEEVDSTKSPEELFQKGYDDYFKVGNYAEAIKYFRLSAEQGYAKGQHSLGLMYAHGSGVEQNYHEAEKWLKLSAKQGFAFSQDELAIAYYEGLGVEFNYFEAIKWMEMAAEQGHTNAILALKIYM